MKLIIEPTTKSLNNYHNLIDGLILPLASFSVETSTFYTLSEIEHIAKYYPELELFVSLNKNIFNKDIPKLKEVLINLSTLPVTIMYYDLAVLELIKDLKLNINTCFATTHFVTNAESINYYLNEGVNYALLTNELTLEEIKEIRKKTTAKLLVNTVYLPNVAFSKRKLLSNFYHAINEKAKNTLEVNEAVSDEDYLLTETENGTNFTLNELCNGTSLIKDLNTIGIDYLIFKEGSIETIFIELLKDTKDYLADNCENADYVNKYKMLGTSTNFFYKESIFQVKHDEKN
jgi:hypothetical protein